MKSLYVLTALAAFNLMAAQKTTQLKDFKGVTFGSDMKVTLVKSTENKLVTQGGGDDEDDDEPTIKNEGTMLVLNGDDNNVTLYYKGALESIIVGPDSKLSSDDEIKAKEFKLIAGEDAVVSLNLNVEKLSTVVSADAVVTLTGKAKDHSATLSEDAVFKGTELLTENTSITLSPDADANITAKGLVNAFVGEDGSLKIHGNPKKVTQSKGEDASIVVVN